MIEHTTSTRRGRKMWLRRFNKKVTNAITLRFAGGRVYAVVHHVGRSSGRLYTTPVVAIPYGDGFVIPLPYGADTDWCRNVLAADRCTLDWHQATYTIGAPDVIDAAQVLPTLPLRLQSIYRLLRIGQFLKVQRLADAGAELAKSVA